MCLPKRDGNMYSAFLFSYMSENAHIPKDMIPACWRSRLLAPIVSGRFLDAGYHGPYNPTSPAFQNVFGFYHAFWLFLLFLALIAYRKDALLIMLGVFCGLMYNLIIPAGMYYYPWDMPALFFFTLACLLYDRRRYWPLIVTVYMGSLFKETTLCCALLILLDGQWTLVKRVGGFLGTAVVTLATLKMLEAHYHVHTVVLPIQGTTNLAGLFLTDPLFQNVRALFSLVPNQAVFVNAGSLFLAMLLPWRSRRDVVLKVIMLVFVAGQALYGISTEVRIWYEMLPLGWMLLSERIFEWRLKPLEMATMPKPAVPAKKTSVQKVAESAATSASHVFLGSYWLMLGLLFILALVIFVIAEIKPPPPPPSVPGDLTSLKARAQSGDVDAEYKLGVSYEQDQDYDDAVMWFQKAAQQGNVNAEDSLGVLQAMHQDYADAEQWFQRTAAQGDAGGEVNLAILELNGYGVKQDVAAAAVLLQKAAMQGAAQAQYILGQLYERGQGVNQDFVQAYKWLKLAQMQGSSEADKELTDCSHAMTPDQIAVAEKLVSQYQASKP